ncbi:MAG: hypothetical protein FJ098_17095 [Deltaproteobacteria bacterium]|nr:hypothetical protein [Deltaproteobacteria bacterium]
MPALLPGLANDLQIPLAVARAGARTVFVQDAVAWEHLSDSAGEEHARKVRMATRGLSHVPEMLRLAPGILKAQYLVHKVLRWLTGVALVEVLALNVILAFGMGGLYTALLACQGLFYAAAALGAVAEGRNLRVPLLRFPRYFVLMHLAGLEAVMNVLRGRTFETWEKPTSTRRGGAPLPGGA